MSKNITVNESHGIIEKIILNQLEIDSLTKKKIIELIKPFPGNKWAALLVVAPFIDGSENPLREATKSIVLFSYEVKNPKSAFARKITNSSVETSYERMKWFYELKQSSPISQAIMYALQEAEMAIRVRKNIATEESTESMALYSKEYKSAIEKAVARGLNNETSVIEALYSIQTLTPGFWCV